MYHYIRNKNTEFPYYNSLSINKFQQQLKRFARKGIVSNYDDLFFENKKKFLLTFDDSLKDHLYAAELLKKNDSIGLFFVPTLPLKNNDILDVHKVHLILGKVKSLDAFSELEKYLSNNKIKNYFSKIEKKKYQSAYNQQKNDDFQNKFKKLMNYYGNISLKHKILNHLMKKFDIDIKSQDYYLNKKELRYLSSLGMIIGSHGESHTLLSRLSYKKQYKEITNSKFFLEKIINKEVNTFCYPYGRKMSYNKDTLKILRKLKFQFAYSVEYRDIKKSDIKKRPLELPRYDCNQF
tara:strand:+ start:1245 stop:2123 length:879 start_codon:yes stop_codon:yes gene_type:complete